MKVNDVKQQVTHEAIGKPVGTLNINDAEMAWLIIKGGTGDTLEQRWVSVMMAAFPQLIKIGQDFNDNATVYLRALGYIKTLPEMWLQFWLNGGEVRAPVTHTAVTVTHNGENVYYG